MDMQAILDLKHHYTLLELSEQIWLGEELCFSDISISMEGTHKNYLVSQISYLNEKFLNHQYIGHNIQQMHTIISQNQISLTSDLYIEGKVNRDNIFKCHWMIGWRIYQLIGIQIIATKHKQKTQIIPQTNTT